ncbi:bleomycin resistance family protein [Spirochaetia bacterium]|nr:bleomycin resistance family protein [Spirochaetia bacterium]GHU30997.1 bleomycin resistance family protein [Spirochaetia bacterium]
MDFKDLMPNLMVKDVGKTVDFYKNVLGFNVLATVPENGPFVFAMVNANSVIISFQEEKSIKEEYPQLENFSQGGCLTLYIHVTNVNKLYEKVKGKAKIAKEVHKTPQGSTDFAIEDCNGYILTFAQQD